MIAIVLSLIMGERLPVLGLTQLYRFSMTSATKAYSNIIKWWSKGYGIILENT